MSHSPFRLLRTSVVGATILGLAASAHLLGGGTLPAPPIMAAILALHLLCSSIAMERFSKMRSSSARPDWSPVHFPRCPSIGSERSG